MIALSEFFKSMDTHRFIKGLIVFCCLAALAFLLWDCFKLSDNYDVLRDGSEAIRLFANSLAFFAVSLILGLIEASAHAAEQGNLHHVIMITVGVCGGIALISAAFLPAGPLQDKVLGAGASALTLTTGFYSGMGLERFLRTRR